MNTSGLLEAIRIVKENERGVTESYADAAQSIQNSMGKAIFEQLSEYEKYHCERLTALEKSLQGKGEYIDYNGKEFPLPPIFEIKAAQNHRQKSVLQIITGAREIEKEAEKAYADPAIQIADPQGHAMFNKLSEEEHSHYRVLSDAYWIMNNLNVWK